MSSEQPDLQPSSAMQSENENDNGHEGGNSMIQALWANLTIDGIYSFLVLNLFAFLMVFLLLGQILFSPLKYFAPSLYEMVESKLITVSVVFQKVVSVLVSQGDTNLLLYHSAADRADLFLDEPTLMNSSSTAPYHEQSETRSNASLGSDVHLSEDFSSKFNFDTEILVSDHKQFKELCGNALVISNHVGTADWITMFNFFDHYLQSASKIRFMMKEQHRSIPVIGTAASLRRMIFLKRDLESDKQTIMKSLEEFKFIDSDCWLLLYPEGTFVTPTTLPILHKVQSYAMLNNLPVMDHVLNPRTKGLELCLHKNHGHMFKYLISVTLAYSKPYDVKVGEAFAPSLVNFFRRQGRHAPENTAKGIHVHIRVHSTEKILNSDRTISDWVNEEFHFKEKILRLYRQHGKFPGQKAYSPISTRDVFLALVPPVAWIVSFYYLWPFILGKVFFFLTFLVSFAVSSIMVWYDYIHQNELLIPNKSKKEN